MLVGEDYNGVSLEIGTESASRMNKGKSKFLDLRVAEFSTMENLAGVVNWFLEPLIFPYQDSTNGVVRYCEVEEEGLVLSRAR